MRSSQLAEGDLVETTDGQYWMVVEVRANRSEVYLSRLNRLGVRTLSCREVVKRWRAPKTRS